MTQEEKAKAYDEALERANKQRADYQKELDKTDKNSQLAGLLRAGISAIDMAFPELRESEDEKVIKALETFINLPEIAEKITFEARIMWLSWLEKQKEQNGEDEECTDFTIYHPLKNGKGKYECIPYNFYGSLTSFSKDKDLIDFLRTCFYTKEECNEWIKQQKEQKPIKVYRVENEDKQKGLWRKFDGTWEPLFDILTDGLCRDLPMEDSDLYREGGKKWFASAPSRETLQKWFSKRDLEELTAAGFTISEFEVTNYKKVSEFEYIFTRDSIINRTYLTVSDIYPEQKPVLTAKEAWKEMRLEVYAQASGNRHEPNYSDDSTKMFSLCDIDEIFEKIGNSTVEQKPAWSEEDEKMRNLAIEWAETMSGQFSFVDMGSTDFRKIVAWLKSLRPDTFQNGNSRPKTSDNWKPSEEQLNALNFAITYFMHETNYNNPTELRELYEQLKKL